MPLEPVAHEQLLLSLDQRQDDVLERLDELDQQIESLIRVWTQQRSVGEEPPGHGEPVAGEHGDGGREAGVPVAPEETLRAA